MALWNGILFAVSAALLALTLSAQGLNSDSPTAVLREGGGIPAQPYLHCVDIKTDVPKGWGFQYYLKYYDDDSQLPEPFNLSGLNATGLYASFGLESRNEVATMKQQPISEGDSQYLYVRYLSYRPNKTFPMYYDNIVPAIRGNSSVFIPSAKIEWQEVCFDLTQTRNKWHEHYIHLDVIGPRDALIIDKMIGLNLPPGSSIKCSRDELDEIRQFCGYQPDTPETTQVPPTSPTYGSTTREPEFTEPPTETPLEPFVQCLDDFSNDWPSDWTRSLDSIVCEGYKCLPAPFDIPTDAQGILYLKNDYRDVNAGISWPKYGGNSNRTEYFYARYFSFRLNNNPNAWADYVSPASSNNNFHVESYWSNPISWSEICVTLDHTNPDQNRRLVVDNMRYGPNSALLLDKLIYLSLPPGQTISCSRDSYPSEILAYCDGSQVTSTTATPPPPSVSPTDSTWRPSTGTPICPPTTASPPPPSVSPTDSTWRPSTETPTCPLPQEWVDDLSDMHNSGWSYTPALEFAYDTSELPSAIGQNLTSANGLFYFRGSAEGGQSITRYRTSNAVDSYLIMRYYIHHTSEDDTQQYYVAPVADKAFGVYYLDTTSNSRWKEALLHLDVDSDFSFQIGTTATSGEDIFIIDKIIYNQRN